MTIFSFPQIVTDGLVLCLDAGNQLSYPGTGTTWTDLTRNKNNGALTNGPTFSGAGYGSISFDGSNDYVSTSFLNSIHNSSHTISLITRFDSVIQNYPALFFFGNPSNGTNGTQIYICRNNDATYANKVILEHGDNINKSFVAQLSTTLNKWIHICGVINKNTSTMELFINSVSQGTSSISSIGNISVSRQAELGRRIDGSNLLYYASCLISNTLIYNRALTQNEVLRNYLATKGRFGL